MEFIPWTNASVPRVYSRNKHPFCAANCAAHFDDFLAVLRSVYKMGQERRPSTKYSITDSCWPLVALEIFDFWSFD